MSDAIGATGERSKPSQLEIAEPWNVATKSQIIPKSYVRLLKQKGMESSVSNFPGSDDIAQLGAEAEWENFATCCKLWSTEIFAKELDVSTATESTNMMFITGIFRKGQYVLVITMTRNQLGAQLPRGPKGTLIKNDDVTSMMLFKRANRTCAPNMRRERVSQNRWNLVFFVDPELE